tara:strand:- start:11737 stop:12258 length:522 start_codon:yes stop_codon:yes gene_type:complete
MPTVVQKTRVKFSPVYPNLGPAAEFLKPEAIGKETYWVVKSTDPAIPYKSPVKLDEGDMAKVSTFEKGKGSPMFFAKKNCVCLQVWVVTGKGTGIQVSIPVGDFSPGVVQGILDRIDEANIPRRETFVEKVTAELHRIGASAPDTVEAGGGAAETTEEVAKTTAAATELPTHA